MMDLRLAESDLTALRTELLGRASERCAVLLAAPQKLGRQALLVRETVYPAEEDYARQSPVHAELKPEFVARVTKRAKLNKLCLIFVHTHPGDAAPEFSATDDSGEEHLRDFLARRDVVGPHAAMVMSKGGVCARRLGQSAYLRVVSVGNQLRVEYQHQRQEGPAPTPQFDRQIRAFGEAGQRVLRSLRVGIVGLGGTGSIAAQQLAHLGVRDFVLIDPDQLEVTNLNRVVGVNAMDIGQPKVELAARHIRSIAPDAQPTAIRGDVVHASVASELLGVDLLLGCTDSHGSRSVIQQLAYQYLIPCVDMGSTITAAEGEISGIFGRVQALGPDHACLWCTGLLSSEEVRRDMMTDFERKADPYIQGAHEPAPAVISLNATVVSLAMTMLLGMTTGAPVLARHLNYNAVASSLRAARASPQSDCFICSRKGVFGRGDLQALYARQD